MCREAGDRRSHQAGVRRALRKRAFTLELIFHTEALAFDDDGVGMMQQPIQDRGGQGAIMVEDRGPLLEGAVGGNDQLHITRLIGCVPPFTRPVTQPVEGLSL